MLDGSGWYFKKGVLTWEKNKSHDFSISIYIYSAGIKMY